MFLNFTSCENTIWISLLHYNKCIEFNGFTNKCLKNGLKFNYNFHTMLAGKNKNV